MFVTVVQRLTANSKSHDHTSQILIFLHKKEQDMYQWHLLMCGSANKQIIQ
jgi:hypothetical protein